MNNLKYFIFWLLFLVMVLYGCKEYNSLDSIKISPLIADSSDDIDNDEYVCRSVENGGKGNRRFVVTGIYDDDETEDLSNEVEWTTDGSDDTNLFDIVPGYVKCNKAYGPIGVLATYKFENGVSGEGEEGSTSDLTDSAVVNAK